MTLYSFGNNKEPLLISFGISREVSVSTVILLPTLKQWVSNIVLTDWNPRVLFVFTYVFPPILLYLLLPFSIIYIPIFLCSPYTLVVIMKLDIYHSMFHFPYYLRFYHLVFLETLFVTHNISYVPRFHFWLVRVCIYFVMCIFT